MITGDNRKTAAAMSLSSVSVLSNALRLKRFKAQTGKEAVTSFDKVLNTEGISITADEVNKGWSLKRQTVVFVLSGVKITVAARFMMSCWRLTQSLFWMQDLTQKSCLKTMYSMMEN